MLGVLVTLTQGAPPVAIPCSNRGSIPGMMAHIHSALSLPLDQRLAVIGLGTVETGSWDPVKGPQGMGEFPVNLIPIHLIGSAQVVDFRTNDDGVMFWIPYELAQAKPEDGA